MRRVKIVCTLGPASSSQEQIDALVAAGMDCARLNFSHGEHADHAALATRVREAAHRAGRPLAILGDLCGPKIRVGRFGGGPVTLTPGATFTLTTRPVTGNGDAVSTTHADLPKDVRPGATLFLDDGLIRLRAERVTDTDIVCQVEIGGVLSDHKGINLPGTRLSMAGLTPKDERDLAFAVDVLKVDYLALSFVRTPTDVMAAQRLAKGTPVIAKLEKPEAVENLSAIADVADGVMVARGDLGVELGAEKVPLVQKRIIREVNRRGKLAITATQMLDSMIRNPRPTRAEAADVANAVLDGTDAVMLSGETASGGFPVESVRMMNAIAREVESVWLREQATELRDTTLIGEWDFANAATRAAALLSRVLPLAAIVVFTRTGRSARLLSDYRPRAPVVAVSSHPEVAQQLALCWGVIPRIEIPPEDLEETLRIASSVLAQGGLCKKGDSFALVAAWPASGHGNTVKLHRL